MTKADLDPIEAARRKVAMLTKDVQRRREYVAEYMQKLSNSVEDLEIAKRELAELEKVEPCQTKSLP